MNLQSNEANSGRKANPLLAQKNGTLIGGFSVAYTAAASNGETEKGTTKPTAETNNCHGGNCAAGCGVKAA